MFPCTECPKIEPNGSKPEKIVTVVRRVIQTDLVMKKDPRPWKRPVKVAIRRERLEVVHEANACAACAEILLSKDLVVSEEPPKEYTRDNCPGIKASPISEEEWKRLAPKGRKEEED